MVYSKKCSECGKLIDFGGEDPEENEYSGKDLPENAMRFNGELYCRECVKKFVEFGTGDILERIQLLAESIEDIQEELGMEKNLNS